jgi:hypothetical protein
MPIKHNSDGTYQWGKHGKKYKSRKGAERQAAAAHANGYTGKSLANRIDNFVSKAYNKYAVATAQAEESGHSDFSERGEGRKKRDEIAEAIEREAHKKGKKVDSKGNVEKMEKDITHKAPMPFNIGNTYGQ